MAKLVIIDGNSLMYRAFYALPLLTNDRGEYTNAVYGFMNMYFRILEDAKPEYLTVAFDVHGPTFRHEQYGEYKAGRKPTPDELRPQFDILKKVLEGMAVHYVQLEGFEADDFLGTLSRMAEEVGWDTVLVTGDRDALQLASRKTRIWLTHKGISEIVDYGPAELKERYGLAPEQIVDLKGLMGDASDNIPGVPGVGEKTALKLLHEFGTVEMVLENVDQVSGKKLQERLRENREQAFFSKGLAKIDRNVPLKMELETFRLKPLEDTHAAEVFQRYGFRKLMERLKLVSGSAPRPKEIEIEDIRDIVGLKAAVSDHIPAQMALYVEPEGMSVYDGKREYRITFGGDLITPGIAYSEAVQVLKPWLEDPKVHKIVLDAKTLMHELDREKVQLSGTVFDALIAAYLIKTDSVKYPLEQLKERYLSSAFPNSAYTLWELVEPLQNRMVTDNATLLYEDVEMPLVSVLFGMEKLGFSVDTEQLSRMGETLSARIDTLTAMIYDLADEKFNINSTRQLGTILFEKLQLPAGKKTKSGYSTDIDVLEQLRTAHPIVPLLIEYRQLTKLKSTYIDGLLAVVDGRGRVHTVFHQTVVATGRLSSSEPNLQNIPVRTELGREIRKVFVAEEGSLLVDADYSQIELRVLAHMSGDPRFIEAFRSGEDIHARTASEVFGVPMDEVTPHMRSSAKAVNFGIVYGISDFGLSQNLGISRKEAGQYIDLYFERYPKIKEFMNRQIDEGKEKGYVETLLGRRRYFPQLNARQYNVRAFAERAAMNAPVQGTAADIIKLAMIAVDEALRSEKLRASLILQVHDELIVETPMDEVERVKTLVKERMESVMELEVPLIADVAAAKSWYECK